MTFEEYQKLSRKTAIYPRLGSNYIYPTLGLADEAGEVVGKVKKVIRDKNEIMDEETKMAIAKELGDVLWYVAQMATELGLSLDEIASCNIKKLLNRQTEGTLRGNGDNR